MTRPRRVAASLIVLTLAASASLVACRPRTYQPPAGRVVGHDQLGEGLVRLRVAPSSAPAYAPTIHDARRCPIGSTYPACAS